MQIEALVFPPTINLNLAAQRVVVIDVLRATSTMVTALGNKALEVVPVIEPQEAVDLLKKFDSREYLTGGERQGLKIPGFDLGNSPREYTRERVQGKKIIMCTTNGTKAVKWAQSAAELFLGSFLNVQAVVDRLQNSNLDLIFICAGRERSVSLEDLACAGMMIQLLGTAADRILTDGAKLALYVWGKASADLEEFVRQTQHGRYLTEIGLGNDIHECSNCNQYPIVPQLINGKIGL